MQDRIHFGIGCCCYGPLSAQKQVIIPLAIADDGHTFRLWPNWRLWRRFNVPPHSTLSVNPLQVRISLQKLTTFSFFVLLSSISSNIISYKKKERREYLFAKLSEYGLELKQFSSLSQHVWKSYKQFSSLWRKSIPIIQIYIIGNLTAHKTLKCCQKLGLISSIMYREENNSTVTMSSSLISLHGLV
jgi:hypothetical protein